MKTLVIHPKDHSTDFLTDIYSDKNWNIVNDWINQKDLLEKIIEHDRIVMMGHGIPFGLIGHRGLVVNSYHSKALRGKECVYIWCNADQFVQSHGLRGFYTGMVISEWEEAMHYDIMPIGDQIMQSNELFARAIKGGFDSDKVKSIYNSDTNPIIQFNNKRIYGKCN